LIFLFKIIIEKKQMLEIVELNLLHFWPFKNSRPEKFFPIILSKLNFLNYFINF
jgi:hypothetical protein